MRRIIEGREGRRRWNSEELGEDGVRVKASYMEFIDVSSSTRVSLTVERVEEGADMVVEGLRGGGEGAMEGWLGGLGRKRVLYKR